jgi:type I restriction enzyme S subunit
MSEALSGIAIDLEQLRLVRGILARYVPGRAVWAFGSRAKGKAKPYSDLDLAIITDEPLPLSTRALLAEAFSESDLPWRVDLVDWATTGEAFRAIIERDKVAL